MDWEFIFMLSLPWEQGEKRQWGRNVYKGKENLDSRLLFSMKERKWSRSAVSDSATPWTVAYQALLPIGFSRQEYWSGLPFPSWDEKILSQSESMRLGERRMDCPARNKVVILQMAVLQNDGNKSWRIKGKTDSEEWRLSGKYHQVLRKIQNSPENSVCVCVCVKRMTPGVRQDFIWVHFKQVAKLEVFT